MTKQEKIRTKFDKHRQDYHVHAMALETILREIETKCDLSDRVSDWDTILDTYLISLFSSLPKELPSLKK